MCNFGYSQNFSIKFDGDNDYVEVVNSALFNFGTNDFTLEHWFKTDGSLSGHFTASIIKLGSNNHYYEIIPRNTNYGYPSFHFCNGDLSSDYHAIATSTVDDGNWHHLCGVRQSDTIFFYIDGDLEGQATMVSNANADNTGTLKFKPYSYTGTPIDVYMDEVRIWDRALSASEVLANSTTCSLTGTETGLIGYWNFNEGTGTITYDQTSNGNNGTLINGPVWSSDNTPCYSISTSANPTNGGSTTGEGDYLSDTQATVIASPYTGWIFQNWTEYGNQVSTNPIYTFTVTGNRALVANFYIEVGIDEIKLTFNIFPNPSYGIVHIRSNKPIEKLLVYNSIGVVVKHIELNNTDVTLDISLNPKGVYFVKLIIDNKVHIRKVFLLY